MAKRKEEHTATSSRKVKSEHKESEATSSGHVTEEGAVAQDEAANGECDLLPNQSTDEHGNNDEVPNSASTKGQRELKAPRVLEVCDFKHLPCFIYIYFYDTVENLSFSNVLLFRYTREKFNLLGHLKLFFTSFLFNSKLYHEFCRLWLLLD